MFLRFGKFGKEGRPGGPRQFVGLRGTGCKGLDFYVHDVHKNDVSFTAS